ncbi:MAG: YkgJ family cysteine cluster protein [Desulfobacteraceae bacterium]|nr:MAG: YkgJ family cysteine cluster protein [Desulfobacteraceae bacterium]
MKTQDLFQAYEFLADKADGAFGEMQERHGSCIKCSPKCADCCHAVFGLFLIEAAYIKQQFDRLPSEAKKEILFSIQETERGLRRLESKMRANEGDPDMQAQILATERVKCPLLNSENECSLYDHRPITCRVYGIPTRIQGKARVCGKAGFEKGGSYPAFDLDSVYRDLFELSKELLARLEEEEMEKASLLVSLSKAIVTPIESLVREDLEQR